MQREGLLDQMVTSSAIELMTCFIFCILFLQTNLGCLPFDRHMLSPHTHTTSVEGIVPFRVRLNSLGQKTADLGIRDASA